MINNAGVAWLSGPKYDTSARIYGAAWAVGIETALSWRGRTLANCKTIHDVIRVFRGREFWKRDGFYQLFDTVKPPDFLLAEGGDDCDGWAMTHCQAINQALGRYGWKAWAVSYLADPFWMSHHYCLARDPQGQFWVIQPQPTAEDWKTKGDAGNQTVYGPYRSAGETPHIVAGWYNARVVWWDVRDGLYKPAAV